MSRTITILTVVFVGGGIGFASAVYTENHHQHEPAGRTTVVTPEPHGGAPSPSNRDSDKGTADAQQRQADAIRIIAQANDWAATGSPNAHAEWSALDNDEYPTICGVTPERRYYVVRNAMGRTRYDEQPDKPQLRFDLTWYKIGCERTSPVHQQEILKRADEARMAAEKQAAEFVAGIEKHADEYVVDHNKWEDCRGRQFSAVSVGDDFYDRLNEAVMRECGQEPK